MRVRTVLGDDVLLLDRLSGEEGVSTPYRFTLDMFSENPSIAPETMLRSPITITVELATGGERTIHGLVNRFAQFGRDEEGLTSYQAGVVPWFWFLSLSSDCKVHQNVSVLEIVEKVFRDLKYSDFEIKCFSAYPKREYCVQYRETHLNFVSRLLEEEGIFYFFTHSADKHILTLADNAAAVKPCPGLKAARMAPASGSWPDKDMVTTFEREHAVHTGKVTLADYNYLEPALQLQSSVAGKQREETYDYPGRYAARDNGDRYARIRLEEQEVLHHTVRGTSTARSFQSGCRFDLTEHYRRDANQGYLLVDVRHTAANGGYQSQGDVSFEYRNEFVAIPHSVPFRPSRIAQKPVVTGSQTAMVVGKAGEEIWTDKHGRVKVQFYWDRVGTRDEKSSCWVRVSTMWAGKGWGSLSIPRIGQEVIVDFFEGDPDLPIITGKVYNADQAPPYDPSKGGVVSGLRSNTHKGAGYNEMSMDDTAGKEQVTIHAQHNMSTTVEQDDTQHIVKGNRKIDIDAGTHTETIKGNTAITIVAGTYKLDVKANTHTHHVKGVVTENYDADQNTKVAHNILIDAGDKITIKTGLSSLVMESNGTITLHGKNLLIKGDEDIKIDAQKIEVTGGSEVKVGVDKQLMTCDLKKVNVSGTAINSSAIGMHEITGSLVKIN